MTCVLPGWLILFCVSIMFVVIDFSITSRFIRRRCWWWCAAGDVVTSSNTASSNRRTTTTTTRKKQIKPKTEKNNYPDRRKRTSPKIGFAAMGSIVGWGIYLACPSVQNVFLCSRAIRKLRGWLGILCNGLGSMVSLLQKR